ncbi:MAG: hypothetical protein Q8N60_02265 [Candidatus Diapherotrites archaeon]|nr:hypothetical protein [Candidatus Diapherotrites archaeon]
MQENKKAKTIQKLAKASIEFNEQKIGVLNEMKTAIDRQIDECGKQIKELQK